jgi:SAM-dependent methyltransferase
MAGKYGGYDEIALLADLYDAVYENRNPRDINFFLGYSTRIGGATLELGCGTGRVLLPTARSGCRITGLDLSPYMLEKCKEKLRGQSEDVQKRVRLVEGNMTGFETGETYSLVTMPFRPFQHLIEVEEQKECLACIHRHLENAGVLLLDVFHCYPPAMYDPKYWAEQDYQKDLRLADGRSLRCTTRISDFHRDEQYNDIEIIYYITDRKGVTQRLVQAFPFRYFFRYELEHLLSLSGFKVVDLFGDYDKSTFSNDSPEMIFVAEKK